MTEPQEQAKSSVFTLSEEQIREHYNVKDYTERVYKEIRQPHGVASNADFYRQENGVRVPNITFLRLHLYHEGRLTEDQVIFLLRRVTEIFTQESNVLRLPAPITICGDIHGQYYDLVQFMTSAFGGNPMKTNYLFLGDYVDRGSFSVECLLWLFALKIVNPTSINLLRGNHESKHLTNYFTFRLECTRKYSGRIYDAFLETFRTMPLAAIVDNKFFCVHGGIGPELHTISDIEKINRFVEVPTKGVMCDLLWSDPAPPGSDQLPGRPMFLHNSVRGCSHYYTYDAVCKFLDDNNLLTMIRAHEVQEEGYSIQKYTTKEWPSVITIFSAPNYVDAYGNKGAVMCWDGSEMAFKWFYHSPHPFWLPNFADAFSWSLPYVAEKALDMLQAIMNVIGPEEEEKEGQVVSTLPSGSKGLVMSHIYGLLRETGPEGATEFRSLPVELNKNLGSVSISVPKHIPDFQHARTSDIQNERLPPILVPASEAKEFFTRKGVYALKPSGSQLARKVSVGTTANSSPSMRKQRAEVTLALVRRAADLMIKSTRISGNGQESGAKGGKIRGMVNPQGGTSLTAAEQERNEVEMRVRRLLKIIEHLRELQASANTAEEMRAAIRFVEEEE